MQAKVRLALVRTILAVAVGLAAVATILSVVVVTATPRTTLHATLPGPSGAVPSGAPQNAGPTEEPLPSDETQPSAGPNQPPVGPPASLLGAYRAPSLLVPLTDFDPGLATRGPRPTLDDLMHYQYGVPAVIVDPKASLLDWQLSRPDSDAVRGYGDRISVGAGQTIGFHLTGLDRVARLDIFRIGRGDGQHVLTIPSVPVVRRAEVSPDPTNGLIDEGWPRSALLKIPTSWQSGVYLVKLTGNSGGQSYIPFIVQPAAPTALTVVLPTMTYQAYNIYGGADLYSWPGSAQGRAYQVSYNRPFDQEWGAGLFFRLDFPLIVWLEDHGYQPGYVADLDLARQPGLALGAKTIIFSGHGEYWTGAMRDTMETAAAHGVDFAFFGANQAFWQVRLTTDASGQAARDIICYKSATLDPVAARSPADATARFEDPPVNRPPSTMLGLQYGGVIDGILPMVVGPGMATFDPDLGLVAGQALPGLVADEIDQAQHSFTGILLGSTPVAVREHGGTTTSSAALWITTAGNRVFDAGTFDFSWGLDPRYAAALPGFPADAYQRLTAEILAWLGARPTI
jgi:hypothetical protein